MEKISLTQSDIIIVSFPFTDLTRTKIRPALIVSNDLYNHNSDDIIVSAITTKKTLSNYSRIINNSDLTKGALRKECYLRPDKLSRIKKSLVIKAIGKINNKKLKETTRIIKSLF